MGFLLQNPISFAYTSSRAVSQNTLTFLPILVLHLWDGWYLRSADATWVHGWRPHSPWEFRRDKAKADFQKADSDLSSARKLLQEISAKHDELTRESSGLETANDGLTKEKETKEKELGELECEATSNDASNRQTPDPPPQ